MFNIMKTGGIYSFWYTNWKTNTRIIAFILYAGPQSTKVHALNLGARQLNIVDRIKLLRVIKKLSNVASSTNYNGRLLYKIFKTYLAKEIGKCYRTYHKVFVQRITLVNYGLNKPEEYTNMEIRMYNKFQYSTAARDLMVKAMNFMTQTGFDLNKYNSQFAKPKTPIRPPGVNPNETIIQQGQVHVGGGKPSVILNGGKTVNSKTTPNNPNGDKNV